ncbi:MAG: hypothetical protein PHR82_05680, partial [Endomicrobiaceae bacterium]|nr:hypothetical protein [Endomicrobiaceae bacterium]
MASLFLHTLLASKYCVVRPVKIIKHIEVMIKMAKTISNLSLIINKYPNAPTKRDTKNSPILSSNNFAPLSIKFTEIILKYISRLSNIMAIKGEGNLIFS